jgi:hypothetical protein
LLKRARVLRRRNCATVDFDFVEVGRIVDGLRIGDRIKDDGRLRTRVSLRNVLIPAHPELSLTVPELGSDG